MYESVAQSSTATGPSLPVFLLENALLSTSWAREETNSSSTTSYSFSPLNIICIERVYMFTSIGLMLRSMFFCCIQVSSPLSPDRSHVYTWEYCYFFLLNQIETMLVGQWIHATFQTDIWRYIDSTPWQFCCQDLQEAVFEWPIAGKCGLQSQVTFL